jgi:hypothetical protein
MKERPILFSGEMIRAILEERKTQTRRVLWTALKSARGINLAPNNPAILNYCQFGKPGDLLWVRETWDFVVWDEHEIIISYGADGQQSRPIKYPSAWNPTIYNYQRWRPSIFMPRWASRITLKIINMRVEQLWFITEQDILSEGIDGIQIGQEGCEKNKGKFIELWDSINTKRGYPWSSNPWVWVIDYEVIDGEARKV